MDLGSNMVDLLSCRRVTHADRVLIHKLKGYVEDIIVSLVKIKEVNLPPVEEYVQEIEYYRY